MLGPQAMRISNGAESLDSYLICYCVYLLYERSLIESFTKFYFQKSHNFAVESKQKFTLNVIMQDKLHLLLKICLKFVVNIYYIKKKFSPYFNKKKCKILLTYTQHRCLYQNQDRLHKQKKPIT